MLSVEEALAAILTKAHTLPVERIALLDATGRTLDEDIVADIDMPPFTNSAVDGYAVQASDTAGATPEAPILLRTLGEVLAGAIPTEVVVQGTAAKTMTGAPIPTGADAMVMVEDTQANPDGTVSIFEAVKPGQHVRYVGEDVKRGTVVLTPGTRIRAAEAAMLATMGRPTLEVVRRPRVAILSTGDEIVDIVEGMVPPPGKIRNSNRYALAALVQESGAEIHSLTHVTDDLEETISALNICVDPVTGADVIVTAGGVSMGDRDFVKPALERLGALALWKVAMKPGKPLAFGQIGRTLFFGLPGNPVSAMVTFELFVRPALRKMMGRAEEELHRPRVRVELAESISHTPGRREYVRGIVSSEAQGLRGYATGAQGSGILHSMTRANALLIIPEERGDMAEGETVQAILLAD